VEQELTWFWYCLHIAIQIKELDFGKEVDDAKKSCTPSYKPMEKF
jgi:hypothetical protein